MENHKYSLNVPVANRMIFLYFRAVFLGGVNVADFPVSYVEAVIELVRFASENYSDIPWIINTMGFCTGMYLFTNGSNIILFILI